MAELVPIPFAVLLKRMWHEYGKNNAIFDLPARKFYRPDAAVDLSVSFCGNAASNPVGPAAGPQTQLAQNIALSWLAGSRILELKTVQINDRLRLSRPCIDNATIGFNTEWSQELRLDESLREYVKASIMIEILKHWLFEGSPGLDTVFDISVGYNLAGIRSEPIRQWLGAMRDASRIIDEYRKEIPEEFGAYRNLPFKPEIGNSITLSTFHGTPAEEIERIALFLIEEMGYHVIIKMNPPMLGRERLEYLLHDALGYTDIEVNEKVYDVNITFSAAVNVVRRMQAAAAFRGKTVGVKFGNTLEVKNKGKFLKEDVQYLSGQPLHVLHLALVETWRAEFGPDFPISFSAGIDANNFPDCVAAGLVPVTTSTDLMRPGGYGRLPQYLLNLEHRMKAAGAATIDEFIIRSAPAAAGNRADAIMQNTAELLERSIANPRYHNGQNKKPPRKIGSRLEHFDCINCDKCIPVCPNDANFFFEIEPFEVSCRNIEITDGAWIEIDGGPFKIEEAHQIANFADACNECGNCDVFCPEDGGPYIEKPRFFGSFDAYCQWKSLSGYFLSREQGLPSLHGRFKEHEYLLQWNRDDGEFRFFDRGVLVHLDEQTGAIRAIEVPPSLSYLMIDMRYFLTMKAILQGMLNSSRVHFVNIAAGVFDGEEKQRDA